MMLHTSSDATWKFEGKFAFGWKIWLKIEREIYIQLKFLGENLKGNFYLVKRFGWKFKGKFAFGWKFEGKFALGWKIWVKIWREIGIWLKNLGENLKGNLN